MKRPLRILLTSCLLLLPAAGQDSVVRFSNGDLLNGTMDSLGPQQLIWKSPFLEKPTPFFLRGVLDLTLPSQTPETRADHEATVTLTNGDIIRGQLATVTETAVSLDTWYAGRLSFNRLMVADVRIDERSDFSFRGPTGMEGWQTSEDKVWSYNRLSFVSKGTGSIAREDLLPDECVVSFDAAWKGDSFGLKLVLFSDEVKKESPNTGYEMSFQRGSVYLRNCRTQSFLGSAHSAALAEQDRVSIEVRASRKSGKVCLYINRRVVEVWTDPEVARGKFGDALHFISQNPLPLRISRVGVAAWDGVVQDSPEPRVGMIRQFGFQGGGEPAKPAPKDAPKEGRMLLANGDSIEGEVSSIENGVMAVKTPLGDIRLPVARLRTVAMKKVDLERSIRRNGDIRAWFPDGGSIVFRLDSVGEGTLTGTSQNFGSATFKLSAFDRIEFNIYDPDLEDKRAADEW